jgi:CheY-like chemotaxis protein
MVTGHEREEMMTGSARLGMPERRPRVLVLHGDPGARDALRRSLAARSCAVLSAGDATSGLRVLVDELLDLDVLVTDLDLPHRDARSLTHLVRRAGGEQDLPIVVVAGDLAPELRAELLALGVDAIADRRDGAAAVAEVVLGLLAERRGLRDELDPTFRHEAPSTLAA